MIGIKILLPALFLLAGADGSEPAALIFTQTSRYEPACADRFPAGAHLQLAKDGQKKALLADFAASADAALSFDGLRVLFSGKQKPGDAWQIWEVALTGGTPRRITSFHDDAITPFYISPTRIVYARRTPGGFQLEAVTLEGGYTERLTYAPGDHLATDILRDGRILFQGPSASASDIFTVYADGSGVESYRCDHGRDRHAGVELSSGDIAFETNGRLARFTSARSTQVDLPAVKGEFAGRIAEVSTGEWLVAFRSDKRQPFGIYRWRTGLGIPEKLWATAVQPVLIRPHEVPKRHPTALGDREGANLLCLNAYTSHSAIPAGSIASVQVWALNDAGKPVTLGKTDVESDGSFFVQTPSERAIRFELLDREGKTVAQEKGWFWARRGEQRVCVGCHAGPERTPTNVVPAILLHNTEPAKMLLRGAK